MASCVGTVEKFVAANPKLEDHPLVAAWQAAAERIDGMAEARMSGAAMQGEASMLGRFQDLTVAVMELAPPERAKDRLDELSQRRAARRAAT